MSMQNREIKKDQNHFFVLGLMSGTSLDGLDIVAVHFELDNDGIWKYTIDKAETLSYSLQWEHQLDQAHLFSMQQMGHLNKAYTQWLSESIMIFIKKHKLQALDAICSTGHTVLHQPEKGITVQLGNLPEIVKQLPCPVVCDFRTQDVALGGQGAPLVPVGDRLLFSQFDGCLNLGGFANLSKIKEKVPVAFDVCPFNRVLNPLSNKLGHAFDKGGQLAKEGKLIKPLFEQLNHLPYYQKLGPKSLGREWVEAILFPILNQFNEVPVIDVLHTYLHHCAHQIGRLWNTGDLVLLTGGGAHNSFFVKLLSSYSRAQFQLPDTQTIDFKEALIFGFLGVLRLRGEVNCYAAVTGAKKDHVAGKIFFP